jgi:hypothetical protein
VDLLGRILGAKQTLVPASRLIQTLRSEIQEDMKEYKRVARRMEDEGDTLGAIRVLQRGQKALQGRIDGLKKVIDFSKAGAKSQTKKKAERIRQQRREARAR